MLSHHRFAMLGLLPILGLLLACGAQAGIMQGPRWACPSPVPQAYGPTGPIKAERQVCTSDPISGAQTCHSEYDYYAIWEQEYGPGGSLLNGQAAVTGPEFPSPTPYALLGNTYSFGQRVELAPLYAQVQARADIVLDQQRQVYLIEISWNNPTQQSMPINYVQQLRLSSISRSNGTLLSNDSWGVDIRLAKQRSLSLPEMIPPGESRVIAPIIAAPGQPHMVELRLPMQGTQPSAEPTPNADLRPAQARILTVQWINAEHVGPACDSPGALTDWSSADPKAPARDAMLEVKAPEGTSRVIEIALAQVGKRYVWGAEGPNVFDCSGLMYWSYGQIGIRIPRTTATQWPAMHPVAASEWQPGDLVYMDTRTVAQGFQGFPQHVTHVGMLADLDQDGRWDLIHAASPKLGVRLEMDVLSSSYYSKRMFPHGRTVR